VPTRLFVITGVSGSGKTTALRHVRAALPRERFVLRRLDEDGVPPGADDAWRQDRARALEQAAESAARDDCSTVVEGSFLPDDFVGSELAIRYCLLEADDATIRKRLAKRYEDASAAEGLLRAVGLSVEEFVSNTLRAQAGFLRKFQGCAEATCRIDTSHRSEEQVASAILGWIHGLD
jgi:broad-specificity NMP kinase